MKVLYNKSLLIIFLSLFGILLLAFFVRTTTIKTTAIDTAQTENLLTKSQVSPNVVTTATPIAVSTEIAESENSKFTDTNVRSSKDTTHSKVSFTKVWNPDSNFGKLGTKLAAESSFPKINLEGTIANPTVPDNRRLAIFLERFASISLANAEKKLLTPSLLVIVPSEPAYARSEVEDYIAVSLLAEIRYSIDPEARTVSPISISSLPTSQEMQLFNPKSAPNSVLFEEGQKNNKQVSFELPYSQALDGVYGIPCVIAVYKNEEMSDLDSTPEYLPIEDQYGKLQLAITNAWNGKNLLDHSDAQAEEERETYFKNIRNSLMNLYIVNFESLYSEDSEENSAEFPVNPIFPKIGDVIKNYSSRN